jgi:AraC-like DNA-binding protein
MKRASQISRVRPATVPSQLIDGIITAAAAAGVVDSLRAEILRGSVSVRNVGVQQSGRVSVAALYWLWGVLGELAGGHRVGAEIARFTPLSTFGVLAEVATHTMSLVEAFERVRGYFSILHQGAAIEINESDRSFIVAHRLLSSAMNVSNTVVATGRLWANANLALLPERAFGVRLRPVSAELACPAFSDVAGVIAEVFGPDVKFGTTEWRLTFDRSAVLAISRQVESSTLRYLAAYADKELRDTPAIDDIVRMVATEMRSRLAGGPPTVAEIARALGLSTRTLQRRLAVVDRNFRAVLDEVRCARAKELLADGSWDFAEIAVELGYSELSAFTRAAIRWFGAPPSRMR